MTLFLAALFPVGKSSVAASEAHAQAAEESRFLGKDVLWRPREWVMFYLLNTEEEGFDLEVTLRDMNVYHQGERPALIWVVDPNGETVAYERVDDDGVISGNERYLDGVYEMGQDFRYRAWRRANPAPPAEVKLRSPHLEHPELLPAREVKVSVPGKGPGIYRVMIIASWDHWVSLSASRPMTAGVHPGPGPLYVHGDRLNQAYFFVPPGTEDVGIAVTEEIEPFNWRLEVYDEEGGQLGQTEPRTFYSFAVLQPEEPGIMELRLSGEATGASLHLTGVPALLAPTAEAARQLSGGVILDEQDRVFFHSHQQVLQNWKDQIDLEELEVGEVTPGPDASEELAELLKSAAKFLDEQNLDPESEDFGAFADSDAPGDLARLVAWEDAANPLYGSEAVTRRIILERIAGFQTFTPHFFWQRGLASMELPVTYPEEPASLGQIPFRNNYYDFEPQWKRYLDHVLLPLQPYLPEALPPEVTAAIQQQVEQAALARSLQHAGESSNKWAMNIHHLWMKGEFLENDQIKELVEEQLERLLTPGAMGRGNPVPTQYRSEVGITHAGPADFAMTGAGYLAEQWGFDAAYAKGSETHMADLYLDMGGNPAIKEYLTRLYWLMSHMALPKAGGPTGDVWSGVASPSDFFFREPQHVHRSFLPNELRPEIPYAEDLWRRGEGPPREGWPALSEEEFLEVVDNKFYFINTPAYYSIHYGGHTSPPWRTYSLLEIAEEGSADLVGHSDGLRELRQWKSNKPGGLSAVFVRNCGPTLLGLNRDVTYANVVWGRLPHPAFPKWTGEVEPEVVSSGFTDAATSFDPESRLYRKQGRIPHTPLDFQRTIRFDDERIVVQLDLTATAEVELEELWESIPLFADDRELRFFNDDLEEVAQLPASGIETGQTFSARAFDLSAESGAGSTFLLDQSFELEGVEPFRYRRVAASVASLQIPLPTEWEPGQTHTLRYVIQSHQEPVTTSQLQSMKQTMPW